MLQLKIAADRYVYFLLITVFPYCKSFKVILLLLLLFPLVAWKNKRLRWISGQEHIFPSWRLLQPKCSYGNSEAS